MQEVTVNKNDSGQRLDKFLMKTYPFMPKSMLYKGIRNKKIKVNRKRAELSQILKEGDTILLFLPEDALKKDRAPYISHHLRIDPVYEDDEIVVFNKPRGLLSQNDKAGFQDSAVTRLKDYLYDKKEWDPQKENSFTPAIVNRLDRNTSGLVIGAKTAESLRILNEAIRNREIDKYYLALAEGKMEKDFYQERLYLKKEDLKAVISPIKKEGYVNADLDIKVLSTDNNTSKLEVHLLSGRFHQIRATLAYLHHPLLGDNKYGSSSKKEYQLCAYKLVFKDLPLKAANKTISL